MKYNIIGVDLAKNIFKKKLTREKFLDFMSN